jgi:hypothetical protein
MTAWQSCHAVLQWPLLKPLTKVFLATTILEFIGAIWVFFLSRHVFAQGVPTHFNICFDRHRSIFTNGIV